MFKKEKDLDQRTSNIIKNKDAKKLRNDLLKYFPYNEANNTGLTEESLMLIFPIKCFITMTKLTTRTLIYSLDSIPYFYDVNGRNDFYPTIYTLWKIPRLLSQVVIHAPVSSYILRGADLMTPGIMYLDNGVEKEHKVSIRVMNNCCPFAVGLLEIDPSNMSTEGKAVRVLHMFGDMLWKSASVSIPNEGFSSLSVICGDGSCDINCIGEDDKSHDEEDGRLECEDSDIMNTEESTDDNQESKVNAIYNDGISDTISMNELKLSIEEGIDDSTVAGFSINDNIMYKVLLFVTVEYILQIPKKVAMNRKRLFQIMLSLLMSCWRCISCAV